MLREEDGLGARGHENKSEPRRWWTRSPLSGSAPRVVPAVPHDQSCRVASGAVSHAPGGWNRGAQFMIRPHRSGNPSSELPDLEDSRNEENSRHRGKGREKSPGSVRASGKDEVSEMAIPE